jgi:predicted nucleic acid-binding Zn ribbon protein
VSADESTPFTDGVAGDEPVAHTESAACGPAGSVPVGPQAGPELAGPELARAALDAALARRTVPPRRKPRTPSGSGEPRRLRGYSGPGPDPRDPQPLRAVIDRLVKARGWQRPAAEARVFGDWEKVAGADVAAHCRPVKLENGELTVEAESTAWATQLRLLAGRLLGRIAAEVGSGVVRKLHIHGPIAPSWQRGPRRVRGRGPRDTYG